MTLIESAAQQLISEFGVNVRVYPQDSQSPDDSNDPVFFSESENESTYSEHKVRLYTSASEELMKEYGLEANADAMMYSTSDIVEQGDRVTYPNGGYKWNVEETATNQIDASGPYIFIYSMGAV